MNLLKSIRGLLPEQLRPEAETHAQQLADLESRVDALVNLIDVANRHIQKAHTEAEHWWRVAGDQAWASHQVGVLLFEVHDLLEAGDYEAARSRLSSLKHVPRSGLTMH